MDEFEDKLEAILAYVSANKTLDQRAFDHLIQAQDAAKINHTLLKDEIILHGPNGRIIKAKTVNQYKLIEASVENDLVFAVGPAGTGKTYTAVALAVRALKNREVRRIIMTRPAVEAGENLGFLPGDLKEKLDPYLQPLYDALRDMLPKEKLEYFLENKTIEIAPLAFMRGRTLDNAFVILDEAQNTTHA
ncbi:MAG: PhoH family protein, partial [Flavobacteriia bacterium]|nr:PhoH family protein [Flavobacteriia bacterium]